MLELQTFGGLVLRTEDGERVETLAGRTKCLALLAYLAVEAPDGRVRREKVAALLWPDRTDDRSRTSLRVALTQIRQATDADPVAGANTSSVGLARSHVRVDVTAFQEVLEAGEERRALELYEGDFLAGVHVEGADRFQRWADRKRGHLRREAYETALSVGASARAAGDLVAAEDAFRRALDLAPLREEAVQKLIRTLAERGRPADALQLYEAFRERREAELELTPSEELQERVEALKQTSPAANDGTDSEEPGGQERSRATGAEDSSADEGEQGPSPVSGRAPSRWGPFQRRTVLGGLAAVGLLGAALATVWHLLGAGGGSAAEGVSDRSVAVLPFVVTGRAADTWGDGMVSLLSTSLDGAAGLRTVADRTIFAELEKRGWAEGGLDTGEALEAARAVGARYGVVGSASQLSGELQLTVRLYETRSGKRLEQTEVRGPPDDVTALIDTLTRRMLAVLLEGGAARMPSVDLASLTTESLPALKSFLAGERYLRAAEYEEAIEAFEAALEDDSTFALAYQRLGRAHGWALHREDADRNLERAYRLADQLPGRERRLVRMLHLSRVQGRYEMAVDSLRELTDQYPDDPILWYQLGETLWHGKVPRGWPAADTAFQRAVELDPEHAIYHPHLVQLAISVHDDSALAAERVEAVPREEWQPHMQIALDLAYGSREARRKALARLDTVPRPTFWRLGPWHALRPPVHDGAYQQLLMKLGKWGARSPTASALTVRTQLHQGQINKAVANLRDLDRPLLGSAPLSTAMSVGIPVPDSLAHSHLAPSGLPDDPVPARLLLAGRYLVDQGRGAELETIIERLRRADLSERQLESWIAQLRGYRAWKAGKLEQADSLWHGWNTSNAYEAIWRGDLYRDLGEPKRAEGWYRAAWPHPLAHDRLGRLYGRMGEPDEAAAAYRRFIAAWEDADPELQSRVQAARVQLRELNGPGPETKE